MRSYIELSNFKEKKHFLIVLAFLICSFFSFSQNKKKIYFDENFSEINVEEYNKKFNSNLFYLIKEKNDTATLMKLAYQEFYGKLGRKKHQLNKIFKLRENIDTTKTWLIHYTKSFKVREKSKEINLDTMDSCEKYFKVIDNYENLLHEIKEVYKTRHKNVELIHLYSFNKELSKKKCMNKYYRSLNLYIENMFNDGYFIYKTIVIHPNGDFYAENRPMGKSHTAPLALSIDDFEKLKLKWIEKLKKLN